MNTEDSRREKAAQEVVSASLEQKVESILQEIETIMDQQNIDTELSQDVDSKLVIDIKDHASDKGSTRSVSGRSRSSR
jgi:chaperonin cofactor prefoldin